MIAGIVKKGPYQLIVPDLLAKDQQIILLLYLAIDLFLTITYYKKPIHKIFHMIRQEVGESFLKGTKD